jgi:hypothetical protein
MIRSTYSLALRSCEVSSLPGGSRDMISVLILNETRVSLIILTIELLEFIASLPPFRMHAFPD